MSFFGSLFGGASPVLNSAIGQYGQVAGYGIGNGEKDINQASKFYSSILSGDSGKTAQALAPEISAEKKATQQDQKTTAMFGGRTGGTAASNAASSDKVHADITNLTGSLTNSAAGSLASLGSNLLNTGTGALGDQVSADAKRMQNWQNSILGKGITSGVQAAESFATGGVSGMAASSGSSFLQGGAAAIA